MAHKVLTFRMQLSAFIIALFIIPPVLAFCMLRIFIVGSARFFSKMNRQRRPKVLDDPNLGEHGFIRRKNGIRLHYVAKGPEDGPLLLCLHGFPESWYSWRHQLTQLSYIYRVVALDLRGFGESDKPKGLHNYTMKEVAKDISESITALGYNKCILVGHELGGMVAMATASLYGHQVERLIILSCPHLCTHFMEMGRSWNHLFKSLYVIFVNIKYLSEVVIESEDFRWLKTALVGFLMGAKRGTFQRDDIEAVKYYMGINGTLSSSLSFYRMMYRQKYIELVPTSNIYAPTLLLWGTSDFIFEPYLAALTKSRYIKNARIEYIQGAGHWLQQEEPRKVNECIVDFVETENSNIYLDDEPGTHSEEDTLDEIEDDVLDDKDLEVEAGTEDDSGLPTSMNHNDLMVHNALTGSQMALFKHAQFTGNDDDDDADDECDVEEMSLEEAKLFLQQQYFYMQESSLDGLNDKYLRDDFEAALDFDAGKIQRYSSIMSLPSLTVDVDYPAEDMES